MSGRVFREYSPHLHSPITYGVSQSELGTEGKDFSQRCSWRNLAVWEIKGKWLRLEPRGSIALYFPLAALEEAGILEPVKQLAMRHGTEFNKPKGRAS